MRVVITPFPDTSHLSRVIPLAWALLGAGHEVRVAAHPVLTEHITAAGLDAVPLRGSEALPHPGRLVSDFFNVGDEGVDELAEALSLAPDDRAFWGGFAYHLFASLRIFHPFDADPGEPHPMADDLVAFADHWRPDLVVWDPIWPSGGVAARHCGAAGARLMWGLDYCGWTYDRFAERAGALPAGAENPMVRSVRPMAERYGLEVDERLLVGDLTVDQVPGEIRVRSTRDVVDMRQIPYTGPGVVPEWLLRPPERPRIAFTLGVGQRRYAKSDESMIATMLSAFDGMDAEVIATLNSDQTEGQSIPGNVRTFDYVPLLHLLPTCDVLVHHGSEGSGGAATALRVPQVVLDISPQAPVLGGHVAAHGAGLLLDTSSLSSAEIRTRIERVLGEPAFREGADSLWEAWRSAPSPAAVVPVLEDLAARRAAADAAP